MRSCLIFGSGRSGTSMVAGSLSESGYFQGGPLHAPRAANPRGFFESPAINQLNDALIRQAIPDLPGGQGWLAALPAHAALPEPPLALQQQLATLTTAQPFCLKDPRFSYTLPLWQPFLPADTGLICVFRDPLLTATSIVEEARRAAYLQGSPLDIDGALAIWASMYRQVLKHYRTQSHPWLFIHYDQMLDGSGAARLGDFLGAPVDASFADRTLRREPPTGALPAEVAALYAELCSLAGTAPAARRTAPAASTTPDVSVIAIIEDADIDNIARIHTSAASQRGVTAEVIFVDATTAGGLTVEGFEVVPSPCAVSRGVGYLAGLEAASGRYIAFADGSCWRLPNQLARLTEILDQAPDAAMVASDYHISTDGDRFGGQVDLKTCVKAPLAGWRSGVLLRRAALELIPQEAFWPAELGLLQLLRGVNRVLHLAEPLFAVEASALEAGFLDAARDGAAVGASSEPWDERVILSVSLCTYNRVSTLRECLTALCRQNIPTGAFEIVITDDGSTDGTAALLASVARWPVPVRVLRRDNGGLAAARNTGLGEISSPLTLFINDDTIAAGDLILSHITAHHETPGGAILGSFPQPEAATAQNLTAAVESSDLMFCYNLLSTEAPNPPQFFYTCNVSVATSEVHAVGGFDESFRHYGAEDTDLGLRLGLRGMRVRYVPAARATHRHTYTFEYLRRRAKMVAAAHIRLWRRHPDQAPGADILAHRHPSEAALAPLESAAETLSELDLSALRAAGLDALADASADQLKQILVALNPQWWHIGLSAGLREQGYESLQHLLAKHPFDISEVQKTVWVMVPSPDAEQTWVERVVQFRGSFSANDPVSLVLLAGVEGGYPASSLAEGLTSFEAEQAPHIAIIETGLPDNQAVRMFAAADGWVPTGSAQDARWAAMAQIAGCPQVEPAADTAPWPLASTSKTKLLAWPAWGDDSDLRALLHDYARTLCGEEDVTLCLRIDPRTVDLPAALDRLQSLAAEILPDGGAGLDVLLVEDQIADTALPRLGRAVDGLLALPSDPNPEQLSQLLGVPVVHSAAELRARLHA